MLVLFNPHKERIHTFKTYDALFNHLDNMEKVKKKPKRIFARHSYQRLLSFYRYIRNEKLAPYPMAIFEQGLEQALNQAAGTAREAQANFDIDILEIVNGNVRNPKFIPITPDVDVEALRRKWCEDCCKAHGYHLVEVSSLAQFRQPEGQKGGKDGHAPQ